MTANAYLVLTLDRGTPVNVDIFSEPMPTVALESPATAKQFVVAKASALTYDAARDRVRTWWKAQRPWQKRALLQNALIETWKPVSVR